MKKVFFTAIVVIVGGIALMLYLRWDTNRFVESLPKAPPQTSIEQPTDTSSQDSMSKNKNSELSVEMSVLPAPAATSPEASNDTAHRPPYHSDSHSDVHAPPPLRVDRMQEDEDIKQEGESSPSFFDLSLEGMIEHTRQQLIEKHGDIPEIDIYLRLNAPLFQAIKNRETQVRIQRTPEEHLEFSRVMSVLYPNEQHNKMYQDALKRRAERNRRKY